MAQVSRPLQIALIAVLALAAIWFVALRPKADAGRASAPAAAPAKANPSTAPGSSLPGGLGNSVEKARGAQAQSDAALGRRQQAEAAAGSQPRPAPGVPAARPNGATGRAGAAAPGRSGAARANFVPGATASPAAVRRALAARKVVVMLFWNPRSLDDRAVRDEVRGVSRRGGRALIGSAPIRYVSHYGELTRGLQVMQSPTVVVVDRSRRASLLTGYIDRHEVAQVVGNALGDR